MKPAKDNRYQAVLLIAGLLIFIGAVLIFGSMGFGMFQIYSNTVTGTELAINLAIMFGGTVIGVIHVAIANIMEAIVEIAINTRKEE